MWFRIEMVLFRPGNDFIETVECVAAAWRETPAYKAGSRLQVWECAPYLTGIWYLQASCSGYSGERSDAAFKQWFVQQWAETSVYCAGHRVQIWSVDGYDTTAALFEGMSISRARTIADAVALSKPTDVVKPDEVLKPVPTIGITVEDFVKGTQTFASALSKVNTIEDARQTPGRWQAFLWHVVACIWPTANYARWIAGTHPRWRRR